MGEAVTQQGQPVNLAEDHGFVSDCCRFQEGILSEANMKRKYGFANDVWERLGDDAALLGAVEDEKIRRVRTGQQKRERSQHLITKGPAILDSIAADVSASPRHRVDALKVLNDFAASPQENTAAAMDRFVIRIDLSGGGADHVEVYDKSISINADDTPDDGGAAPQRALPVADKRWDDNDVAAAPVKATMRTGYKQADHEAATDKNPIKTTKHEPGRAKSPQEIALAALMARGWE